MASYRIQAIENFDFAKPDEWPRWIRRFERFRQASDLVNKSEEVQISTLVYSMGDKAEDLLQSFNLEGDDAKKYLTVKEKFESYFVKRRNTIYERARFNSRKQGSNETVDEFVTDLYCLAEHCGYGALHDELIRDRIVVGIKDSKLSEKLQMEPELTLEAAVTLARQSESVKKRQEEIRGPTMTVETVDSRGRRPKPQKNTPSGQRQGSQTCTRCGKSPPHTRLQCPAKEAVCHRCSKKGHFKRCCFSKRPAIREVTQNKEKMNQDSEEEMFLGTVTAVTDTVGANSPWLVNVHSNSQEQRFKVDTGADVTVIPESMYDRRRDGELVSPSVPLKGSTDENLEVSGHFVGTLARKGVCCQQNIYVVRNLRRALLDKPAIEALNVVALVESIHKESVVKQFPRVFKGLGRLKDSYKIEVKEDATPFALTTPRRVPIPLLPKVREELQRMEKMGVMSRIEEPSDWCVGMVVVPKHNGKVRICVDLTKLNESVRRERHILPSVEQTLAQIGGAKYFSKLDANSGYWQIELNPDSAKLTTFITPFGRFHFNRLPFGITSAPEHYQRRMTEVVGDIEGVVCLVDDILVSGKTQEEHDQRLATDLSRLNDAGITLGLEKCEINKTSVRFLGQLVDETGVKPDPEKVQAICQMSAPKTVTEVRRFLGMINQLSKFSPHLANLTKPLRDLLSSKNQWSW